MIRQWILCNDNIPDDMKIVLVTYKKYVNYEKTINEIALAYHYQNNWYNENHEILNVIAWIYVPKPFDMTEDK